MINFVMYSWIFFRALIEKVDITQELKMAGNVTIFSPLNEAFDKLPIKIENQNLSSLRRLILRHFVKGFLFKRDMENGTVSININISWVMEFLICWYKISLISSKKKNGLQTNYYILWFEIAPGSQKVPKFQSRFSMSKINRIFIFFHLRISTCKKHFFSNFNFQTFYFLKLCLILVDSASCLITKCSNFFVGCSIFV